MNYEANTTQWKPGDLVLHDADAKEMAMLMKVRAIRPDGFVKTRYIHPAYGKSTQKVYVNDMACLHDPARFGVSKGGL